MERTWQFLADGLSFCLFLRLNSLPNKHSCKYCLVLSLQVAWNLMFCQLLLSENIVEWLLYCSLALLKTWNPGLCPYLAVNQMPNSWVPPQVFNHIMHLNGLDKANLFQGSLFSSNYSLIIPCISSPAKATHKTEPQEYSDVTSKLIKIYWSISSLKKLT